MDEEEELMKILPTISDHHRHPLPGEGFSSAVLRLTGLRLREMPHGDAEDDRTLYLVTSQAPHSWVVAYREEAARTPTGSPKDYGLITC